MATAASRKRAAERLPERRVRDENTLPPEILLLGARHGHEVKCFALGQAEGHRRTTTSLERDVRAKAVDLGEVLSEQREESAARTSKSSAFG